MRTLAIVQARHDSTRLRGKVLETIGEWTVLEHVVRRVQAAVPDVVIATPNGPRDARIADIAANKLRVPAFIHDGPENDVLGRYAACAARYGAEVIVRVTADCPFIDPQTIALAVAVQNMSGAPLVSNAHPDRQNDGQDVEVFVRAVLVEADTNARDTFDREHVTPWMYQCAPWLVLLDKRTRGGVHMDAGLGPLHWALDTPEDLAWMREVARHIDVTPPANVTAALFDLLTDRPDLCRYDLALT